MCVLSSRPTAFLSEQHHYFSEFIGRGLRVIEMNAHPPQTSGGKAHALPTSVLSVRTHPKGSGCLRTEAKGPGSSNTGGRRPSQIQTPPALSHCPGTSMLQSLRIQGQATPFSFRPGLCGWLLALWVIPVHLHTIKCNFLLWHVCLDELEMYFQAFTGTWEEVRSIPECKHGL